jgi:LEA14-like dessication related protein
MLIILKKKARQIGFFALCAALFLANCKTPPKPPEEPKLLPPKIGASVIRVEKLHRNMVEFYVSVSVENPNDVELPAPKHTFIYKVNETGFIRRAIQNPKKLAPNSVTPVVFGLLVYYDDVFRVFPELIKADEAPCTLDLKFDFFLPEFSEEVFEVKLKSTLPIKPY